MVQALVFRLQNGDAAFDIKAADHFFLRPLDNIEHLAFAAAAPVDAGRAHGNDVAVHQPAHLALIKHEIALACGGERHGKAKAVFMRFHAAFHQFQLVGRTHGTAPVDQHLTVARHRFDAALEKFLLRFGNRELVC